MLEAQLVFWTLLALLVCGDDNTIKLKNKTTQVKRNIDLSISRPSQFISSIIVCEFFSDFTPEQRNFCVKHPIVTSTIAAGVENGLRECENQFQHHRWNCTSTFRENASFGQNRAVQGTKEAAFLNAIVSAGVAYSVTVACAKSNISGCNCAEDRGRRTTQKSWDNDGCTNNIAHGIEISKDFLDGSGGPVKNKYKLQIRHNREAGRQAVRQSVDFRCNCHGVSGACTSKTCWETLSAPFERVGTFLKKEYKSAELVEPEESDTRAGKVPKVLVLFGTKFLKPPKEKLVYLDDSPAYCDAEPSQGVPGTKGRVCDHQSKQSHGCHALCCGRGYNKIVLVTKTQCKCQFRWCCEVKCKTCKIKEQQTVCK